MSAEPQIRRIKWMQVAVLLSFMRANRTLGTSILPLIRSVVDLNDDEDKIAESAYSSATLDKFLNTRFAVCVANDRPEPA